MAGPCATLSDVGIETAADGTAALSLSAFDKLKEPASLVALRAAVAARMLRVNLPELLLEMHARTRFASQVEARMACFSYIEGWYNPARLGASGMRSIPIADLYRLPGMTPHLEFTLQPGEMNIAIVVPKTPAGKLSTYLKIRDRESYAFALASAAVALEMDGERVMRARIAVGGVATKPWRAEAAPWRPRLSGRRRCLGPKVRERALDGADRVQRHAGVERRRVELAMAERSRAIMRSFYVIEIEGSAAWNPMLTGATLSAAVDIRPCPPP